MSGTVVNNIVRDSGVIAATAAGLNWNATAITASTVTVEGGNGYWINTTSNTCTITLPSSAEKGDQIVLIDYLRTWGTNKIIINSNGLNYQGQDDTYTVEYNTDGQSVNIVYSDATQGWIPLDDDASAYEPTQPPTQKGIFCYGYEGGYHLLSNLVSSSGVVATDTSVAGTGVQDFGGASYGGDKGIFGYGEISTGGNTAKTNLVSNSGVVSADVTGVGSTRYQCRATDYGTDKAIFGYGSPGSGTMSITNLVSNSGVVATDTTGVGTARTDLAAVGFGSTGQAIFGYGNTTGPAVKQSLTNIVANTGVVATDTSGVGTARSSLAAARYGTDKAIFGFGIDSSAKTAVTNLVSNVGVVASDTAGVGTTRLSLAATSYGGDKAIFGYGHPAAPSVSLTNLVSNTGVVASDTTGVGTGRARLSACGYSFSA